MLSLRFCHFLVVVVSLLCVAQALRSNHNTQHKFARQLSGTKDLTSIVAAAPSDAATKSESQSASASASPSPTASESSSSSSSSEKSSEKPKATAEPTPSSSKQPKPAISESSSPSPTAEPSPSSTPEITVPSSSESRVERPASSSQPTATSTEDGSRSSPKPTPTPSVMTTVEVVTITNSDGSKVETTSTARITTTPGLNVGNAPPENSSMSTKTRNTIIGVVVGIGGAVALGALALLVRRMWWRKRKSEESDGLMDYDMAVTGVEKPDRGSAAAHGPRSPFQSTLENYHQPAQVNASSNF
ncbi:hypothetical protein CP533_3379 [Ophiocordyceps camponoti-saundersi (nom. inval.)]|nr:hypothetical protein CP533_3379 [Ophiocordyceps camponoti-saundersi (nom. inval.)]